MTVKIVFKQNSSVNTCDLLALSEATFAISLMPYVGIPNEAKTRKYDNTFWA